ncbi:Conserved_hypothetical protein [Hexamita inflata]|uniref:Ankyrin repeat-containing protein n=1 Tax=Hexamita inflata TaxID=28002 RepID=A0AA86V0W8_9EUKA|nr:Conserved hypothetical protein [Hexamita inflata]CAI9972101.1 Conserved hypothetical protein [Hexamita inflata]
MCLTRYRRKKNWFQACQQGELDIISAMQSKYVKSLDSSKDELNDYTGFTGSMYACVNDNLDVLKKIYREEFMYQTQTYITNKQSKKILPPRSNLLHLSIIFNSYSCIKFLLNQMRTDMTLQTTMKTTNEQNQTVLQLVCIAQNTSITTLFFNNFDQFTDEINIKNNNPIKFAIQSFNYDMCVFFINVSELQIGCEIVQQQFDRINPLQYLDQQLLKANSDQKKREIVRLQQLFLYGKTKPDNSSPSIKISSKNVPNEDSIIPYTQERRVVNDDRDEPIISRISRSDSYQIDSKQSRTQVQTLEESSDNYFSIKEYTKPETKLLLIEQAQDELEYMDDVDTAINTSINTKLESRV